MDAERIKVRIMEAMQAHKGKVRAIARHELMKILQTHCIDIDDRELRMIYVTLPICSGDPGLWLPVSGEEVEEFRLYLMAKIPPAKAYERVRRIYAY